VHETGGIDDGDRGVAAVVGTSSGETLMARAVGVLKVTFQRLGLMSQQHRRQQSCNKAALPGSW
jgi:hypothetical protein